MLQKTLCFMLGNTDKGPALQGPYHLVGELIHRHKAMTGMSPSTVGVWVKEAVRGGVISAV